MANGLPEMKARGRPWKTTVEKEPDQGDKKLMGKRFFDRRKISPKENRTKKTLVPTRKGGKWTKRPSHTYSEGVVQKPQNRQKSVRPWEKRKSNGGYLSRDRIAKKQGGGKQIIKDRKRGYPP